MQAVIGRQYIPTPWRRYADKRHPGRGPRRSGRKVNISDEARAAQAAASQSGGENAADDDAAGDGKSDAARAFADYMQESRSKAQSSGSPEERLEDLKKKLEKLQSQMAQTAASTNLPEEIKETRIADLSSQVNAVMAQIAELSAETSAKQKQS